MEREAASNEFKSLVVDLRQRAVDCSQVVDVFNFLESLGSFQCRAYVKQVVRLLRVVVCPAASRMPHMEVSTSGCSVPLSVFVSTDLLTMECIEELKGSLLNGHQFLGSSTFHPWCCVNRHPYEDVFGSIFRCYTASQEEKKI